MKPSTAGLVLTAIAVLFALLGVAALAPPPAVGLDAPADAFSAERAMRHVRALAAEPREVGGPGHAAAIGYLEEQLQALGLKPKVQEVMVEVPGPRTGWNSVVRCRNVVARLRGTRQSNPLLLASHYDSVKNSPGAGDDAAGVAVLLETLRAVVEGPPLETDLIFLFTDAEELAMLGARAFMDEHPWAERVKMVINFEARGVQGPALMFETTPGDGPLLRELTAAGDRPAAFSFSREVYRRLPNDTDFSLLRRAGATGYNFAFIGGPTAYHSALDRADRLSPASLQHAGDYALGLVRQIDAQGVGVQRTGDDVVYFSLLGRALVIYPRSVALMLAVTLLLAAAVLVVLALARKNLSLGRLAAALLVLPVTAALIGGVALVAASLFGRPGYSYRLWAGRDSETLIALALALLAAGLALLMVRGLGRWLGARHLAAAGLLWWTLLSLVVSLRMAGASYLFALPLLAALPAFAFALATADREPAPIGGGRLAALAAMVAVAALLWAPALALFSSALQRAVALPLAVALALLVTGLSVPAAWLAARGRSGVLLAATLLVAAIALAIAVKTGSKASAANPAFDSLTYAFDADEGSAYWFTFDGRVDGWTSRYLGDKPEPRAFPKFLNSPALQLAAPAPPLPEGHLPTIRVAGERAGSSGREVDLVIDWPQEPARALIALESASAIVGVTVAGRPLTTVADDSDAAGFRTVVRYYAPPADGAALTVTLPPTAASLGVEVIGDWYGLPELGGEPPPARPPHLVARSLLMVDSTLVYSSAELPLGAAGEGADPASADPASTDPTNADPTDAAPPADPSRRTYP